MLCNDLSVFSISNCFTEQSNYSLFIQIVCFNIMALYSVHYIRQCAGFNDECIIRYAGYISKNAVAIKYNDGVNRGICTNT